MSKLNPKISIILPIYNTKDYLEKCLDSILTQTYKNLEILCIDDGSTDGSELILDQYSKKDKRIKAVHKKNGGESSARNIGLQLMTGEYVGFMDCDDWIEPNMYEKLVTIITEKNIDMAISTWYCDTKQYSEKIVNRCFVSKEVFNQEELLKYIYKRDDYRGFAYMWDKLYKRELFYDKKGQLMLFDEDLVLGGDVLYLAKLAFNTNSAFYIDEAFYHYNQREDSGCHTQSLKKREDWLEAYKRILNYIDVNGIKTEILPWIKRFLAYHSSNIAEMAYFQKNKDVLLRCQSIMRQYDKEYYSTNQEYLDRIIKYKKILEYRLGDKL